MELQIPDLDAFGISPTLGFLSRQAPLTAFSDTYYAAWDKLVQQLPKLIASRTLKDAIDSLCMLNTDKLSGELEHQRAYVVLAFIIHAYVWGGSNDDVPTSKIPPQISEPFLHVCEILGMPSVLSYAGLCLWNWRRKAECEPTTAGFPDLHELVSLASFMGSPGEDAFYHVPVLIEAEGGPLIPLLLSAVYATQQNDTQTVIEALRKSTEIIMRMKQHLPKLYSTLDAEMFYHQLRPYLAGGKGMEDKGLPQGFVFQRQDHTEQAAKFIGGSAAQSSLFQFLDLILGVEHKPTSTKSGTMFQEMRSYMPRKHREFLEAVSKIPSIRIYVQQESSDDDLCHAFDECMKELRSWRGSHIAVVSKYIVRPARKEETRAQGARIEEVNGGKFEEANGEQLKGTGGSALIPFLRQTRDETVGIEEDTSGRQY